MAFPKPKGIQARFANSWAYLTVPKKTGYGIDVDYYADGAWQTATKHGAEYLAPMYSAPEIKTEWRARYTRSVQAGEWTTGRVWVPDNFEEDDGSGPKPQPPTGFRVFNIAGTWFSVTWPDQDGVDGLRLRLDQGEPVDVGPYAGSHRFADLDTYTAYRASLVAVRDGVESDPASVDVLTTLRKDGKPGPADPYNARQTGATDTTATLAWDQDDPRAVQYWQVGAHATPWVYVYDQQATFTELQPDTSYDVLVLARGHDDSFAANTTAVTVTTTGGADPTPPVPTGLRVASQDVPVGRATVAWDNDGRAEFWRVQLDRPGARWRTTRNPEIVFTGLVEGETYQWQVKAVATDQEGYEHESQPAVDSFTFGDDQPPDDPVPGAVGDLEVHCITTTSAKVTWTEARNAYDYLVHVEGEPVEDQVTVDPQADLRELQPETGYTVTVTARNQRGQDGPPRSYPFTTGSEYVPPDEGGDFPAPKGLMVRPVSETQVEAFWDADITPSGDINNPNYWVVSTNARYWYRTDKNYWTFTVRPGERITVYLYTVKGREISDLTSKAAYSAGRAVD